MGPPLTLTGFDYKAPSILYYVRIETRTQLAYKIGITNRSVEERFRGDDLAKITTVKLFHFDTGQEAYNREQKMLTEYARYRYTGGPILTTGNTELFNHDVLKLDDHSVDRGSDMSAI